MANHPYLSRNGRNTQNPSFQRPARSNFENRFFWREQSQTCYINFFLCNTFGFFFLIGYVLDWVEAERERDCRIRNQVSLSLSAIYQKEKAALAMWWGWIIIRLDSNPYCVLGSSLEIENTPGSKTEFRSSRGWWFGREDGREKSTLDP